MVRAWRSSLTEQFPTVVSRRVVALGRERRGHRTAVCRGRVYELATARRNVDPVARGGIELRGMSGEVLKGHLDLLLLAALRAGPAHGYAIIEQLRSRSGGVFDLPEGTIYPALHRLERQGLISSQWSDASGRRRRVYRLKPRGRRALGEKAKAWRSFARGVTGALEGTT